MLKESLLFLVFFAVQLLAVPIRDSLEFRNSLSLQTLLLNDSVYIGDTIQLDLVMKVPQGTQIQTIVHDTSAATLDLFYQTEMRSSGKESDSVIIRNLFRTFSIESCTIPKITCIFTKDSLRDTLSSEIQYMRLFSVFKTVHPDSAELKDIKNPLNAGKPDYRWIFILTALVFLAALTVYFLKKRKKAPQQKIIPVIRKTPDQEAFERLRALEAKKYRSSGLFREYVFELSEIIKLYLEARFSTNAAECTTDELNDWIKSEHRLRDRQKESLLHFFNAAHPVKFAKQMPQDDQLQQLTDDMIVFIKETTLDFQNEQERRIAPAKDEEHV